MKLRHLVIAVSCAVAGTAMVAGANLTAGGLLFALYKQDPRNATFSTMAEAFASAPDKKTKQKLLVCVLGGAALTIGLPLGLILGATVRRRELHGSARFAHHADVKAAGLRSKTGFYLGTHGGQPLRQGGFEHVLLAARTRSHKGVSIVLPNLLTDESSAVVLDIKEENFKLTSAFRQEKMGHAVHYYNPLSEDSAGCNPLSYVSKDPNHRISDVQVLASTIYPIDENTKDPFWNDSARNLFLGLTLLVLETPELPHTIGEVRRQASGKGQPLPDYLAKVIRLRSSSGKPLSRVCVDALRIFMSAGESVAKSILSTLFAPLNVWANPVVDKATSRDDFDLRDLRKKPMTIYACAPARELANAKLLMNIFYSLVITENLREQPQENASLTRQCLLLMDEFTSIGRLDIISKAVAYIASYNLRLALVIQDTEQLLKEYGQQAGHNILTNMGTKIWFAPGELEDAKRLSETIGYITERSTSHQYSNNASSSGGSTGRTRTVSLQRRALMLPQELRDMDDRTQMIVRAGMPVIKATKTFYYLDPVFKKFFESIPCKTVLVDGTPRQVPVRTAPQLEPRWDEFHAHVAQTDYYLTGEVAIGADGVDTAPGRSESELVAALNNGDYTADEVHALVATKAAQFLALLEEASTNYESSEPT